MFRMLRQLAVGGTSWVPLRGASEGPLGASVLQSEAFIGRFGCVEARLEATCGQIEAIRKPPGGLLEAVLTHRGHSWAILKPLGRLLGAF